MSCILLTFSNFIFGLFKIFKNVADLFRFRKFCPRQDLRLAASAFEILEMEKFLNVKLRNLLLIWFDFDICGFYGGGGWLQKTYVEAFGPTESMQSSKINL